MIRQAVAATRWFYGDPPALGMVTFIDKKKVKPYRRRGQPPVWGRTYMLAGFDPVGTTKGGLLAFQLLPEKMPPPERPLAEGGQEWLMPSPTEKENPCST